VDEGTGGLYTGAWGITDPTMSTGQLEDDRIWAVNDRQFSNVLQTVTVQARSNDQSASGVVISDQIDLDPSTPNIVDSQFVVAGQGTWNVVNGNVTYTMLSSYRQDPTPIRYAIRPTDRSNFSKNTATIALDFPVVTSPDGNTPVAAGNAVTIAVLANDTSGDTPVGNTLRFASTGNRNPLVVAGQGTWTITLGNSITFTPVSGFTADPTSITYLVDDSTGNVSSPTNVSVVYQRDSRFVVQVNDSYQTNATGFDVIIVDNVQAANGVYPTIDMGNGVTVTPNRNDTDLTVGRIVWSGAVGSFSRIQIDAKSKPLTTGTMADISLVTNVTSALGGNVEIRASDMSYSLAAGTYTLASPIAGTNNGSVWFTETVGLNNQAFTAVADPSSVTSTSSNSSGTAALTTRSLSWTGSRQVTFASPSSVSLSKSVKVQHTTGTKTTQLTAGGKLVETSQPVDLKPYMDWVLPGASTGVPSLFDRRLQPVANDFGAILRQDAHAMDLSTFSKNQQLWAGSVIVVDGQSVVEIVPDGQADDVLTSGSEGLRRNALKGSSVKKG
jgi:hypothetical protein